MATGLYVMQEGSVMVAYGTRHIAISYAQYKANGYKPTLEKLISWEIPRLCRGGSRSLTFPAVCALAASVMEKIDYQKRAQ